MDRGHPALLNSWQKHLGQKHLGQKNEFIGFYFSALYFFAFCGSGEQFMDERQEL